MSIDVVDDIEGLTLLGSGGSGIVAVTHYGQLGTICDIWWDKNDAQVGQISLLHTNDLQHI